MAGSGRAQLRELGESVLRVEELSVTFRSGRERVSAVANMSFDIYEKETLGLVGESGCGKSTTAFAVVRLIEPDSGKITLEGHELTGLRERQLRPLRPRFQIILQDPAASFNPRRTAGASLLEPLRLWAKGDRATWLERVESIVEAVGLDVGLVMKRRPHQFSGGQLQRLSIARALILDPHLLVCDEPVASLDVSVQAQILNLLEDMKDRYGLTMVFVAHDLAVVKSISDRIAVMYLGKLCEIGSAEAIYNRPAHPYTRALLDSVPVIDTTKPIESPPLLGEVPSPLNPPSGCRFRTRCPRATEICANEEPTTRQVEGDQYVACHHPLVSVVV
jgi:peptide/nickel transport system ATP-binding protein